MSPSVHASDEPSTLVYTVKTMLLENQNKTSRFYNKRRKKVQKNKREKHDEGRKTEKRKGRKTEKKNFLTWAGGGRGEGVRRGGIIATGWSAEERRVCVENRTLHLTDSSVHPLLACILGPLVYIIERP